MFFYAGIRSRVLFTEQRNSKYKFILKKSYLQRFLDFLVSKTNVLCEHFPIGPVSDEKTSAQFLQSYLGPSVGTCRLRRSVIRFIAAL